MVSCCLHCNHFIICTKHIALKAEILPPLKKEKELQSTGITTKPDWVFYVLVSSFFIALIPHLQKHTILSKQQQRSLFSWSEKTEIGKTHHHVIASNTSTEEIEFFFHMVQLSINSPYPAQYYVTGQILEVSAGTECILSQTKYLSPSEFSRGYIYICAQRISAIWMKIRFRLISWFNHQQF